MKTVIKFTELLAQIPATPVTLKTT